jgi:hypothetical protein
MIDQENRYPSSASLPPTALCQQKGTRSNNMQSELGNSIRRLFEKRKSHKHKKLKEEDGLTDPKLQPAPVAAAQLSLYFYPVSGFCCKSTPEHHRPLKVSNSIA